MRPILLIGLAILSATSAVANVVKCWPTTQGNVSQGTGWFAELVAHSPA